MSFIIGGVRKARSRQANVFHPVNIIDFVAYESDQKLSRIREASLAVNYERINFNVAVSAVGMFIIDLARNAIRENEANPELYGFLKASLTRLDSESLPLKLFPHMFALELSARLGFEPMNNYSETACYFDLLEGEFRDDDIRHKHILDAGLSRQVYRLISGRELEKITHADRAAVLDKIIEFYRLHLEGFRELKCLPVLRSVLS